MFFLEESNYLSALFSCVYACVLKISVPFFNKFFFLEGELEGNVSFN